MKILIIGHRGMLGNMLMETFSKDHEAIGWDQETIDITKQEDVVEKIADLRPDALINAAAFTNVDACETEKEIAMKVNAEGVKNLAIAANHLSIPFVHYSTDYVFDGEKAEGYKEDDVPNPQSVYGESKFLAEKYIQEIHDKYYILRIAWLFGPNGKNWVDTMIGLAKKLPKLAIINDQHGKPTYTKDVSELTQKLLEDETEYGIYHASNEEETTWYDFGKEIFRLKELDIPIETISTEEFYKDKENIAPRPYHSSLINTKLPKQRSWKEALKEYIENYT